MILKIGKIKKDKFWSTAQNEKLQKSCFGAKCQCTRFQCQPNPHPGIFYDPAYSMGSDAAFAPTQSLPLVSTYATNSRCVCSRITRCLHTLPLFRHVLVSRAGGEYGMRTLTGIVWRELQSEQYGISQLAAENKVENLWERWEHAWYLSGQISGVGESWRKSRAKAHKHSHQITTLHTFETFALEHSYILEVNL